MAALRTAGASVENSFLLSFTHPNGSMELIEDLNPEEAGRRVDPALKLMMDAVHRYEGYVAQSTRDGICALFIPATTANGSRVGQTARDRCRWRRSFLKPPERRALVART